MRGTSYQGTGVGNHELAEAFTNGKGKNILLKEAIKRYSSSTERTLVFNVWYIQKQRAREVISDDEGELAPGKEEAVKKWVT